MSGFSLHREGTKIILTYAGAAILLSALVGYFVAGPWHWLLILPLWILFGFVLWFFRNPVRITRSETLDIVAPVDGKVVEIKEVVENEYLKSSCIQISIFMSPLNVHVTRYPVSGKVVYKKYHPGKYLVAFHPKSSELNERTTVVVQAANQQEVLFRQIAGAVARRIVLYSKEGDAAKAGEEYGFIKFGSRLDVFVPTNTKIFAKVGDITRGAEDIIARLN